MRTLTRALALVLPLAMTASAQPSPGAPPAEEVPALGPPPASVPPPATSPPANAPAAADPSAVDLALSAWLAEQRDARGRRCYAEAMLVAGELRYVACGEAGVWVVSVREGAAPMTIEQRDLDGHVLGLFVQNGYVWAQISSVHARPLALLEGQITAQPTPPARRPPLHPPYAPQPYARAQPAPAPGPVRVAGDERPAREARVIEVREGHVIIDAGSRGDIADGDHIAFYEQVREGPDFEPSTMRRQLIAVGRVDGLGEERARVMLGLNERVPRTAVAERTRQPLKGNTLAPPRIAPIWEVAFVARPFLVLDNLGAGVFADARAGYRAPSGLHYEALLSPLAVATAEQGAIAATAAVLAIGYDARLFEVGLGLGGQTVNDTAFDLSPGTGITLLQRVRLGARDGLHLQGFSYVALFHSEFQFSSLRIEGQIPLSRGSWLLLGGSGGSIGLGHGEVGLRLLLSGNGDVDSFFLTTTIGGIHMFDSGGCVPPFFDSCSEAIDYAGAMVGVGGEWRL
jgi:hypothetical protein